MLSILVYFLAISVTLVTIFGFVFGLLSNRAYRERFSTEIGGSEGFLLAGAITYLDHHLGSHDYGGHGHSGIGHYGGDCGGNHGGGGHCGGHH